MLTFRRILCPIDFSDASRHALSHAVVLAKWYGSQLTGLYVSDAGLLDRTGVEGELRECLAPAIAAGVQTEIAIAEGRAAVEILEHAASLPADLLVMGTHGRTGFERLVLGSVTEKVIRKALCPVVTVPPPTVSTSKVPFRRLLCPIDFSASSRSALDVAFSIGQESNAHVTMLFVVEWPDEEWSQEPSLKQPKYVRANDEGIKQRLDALVPDDVRNWSEPETRVAHGKPYQKIVEIAGQEKADLILMGIQGRSATDLMLYGLTTNQVVRRATCPVMTLRS